MHRITNLETVAKIAANFAYDVQTGEIRRRDPPRTGRPSNNKSALIVLDRVAYTRAQIAWCCGHRTLPPKQVFFIDPKSPRKYALTNLSPNKYIEPPTWTWIRGVGRVYDRPRSKSA
jgi:hypothetical protein